MTLWQILSWLDLPIGLSRNYMSEYVFHMPQEEDMFVRISRRNNIWAFCGWEEDTVDFRIYTDSDDNFDNLAIETSPRLGNGCRYDRLTLMAWLCLFGNILL